MRVRTTRLGPAVVIRLEGRLTVEAGCGWLGDAVQAAGAAGVRHVLCELGGVDRLDCTGIGDLMELRRAVHGLRRTLALASVERRQACMLERAGLVHVLRIFADRQAAAGALGLLERRPRCTMLPWRASPLAARSC